MEDIHSYADLFAALPHEPGLQLLIGLSLTNLLISLYLLATVLNDVGGGPRGWYRWLRQRIGSGERSSYRGQLQPQ